MKKLLPILIALISLSCTGLKSTNDNGQALIALQNELDSLKNVKTSNSTKGPIATFLTFQENNAEEAMNFYVELFDNSRVIDVQRWGKDGPAKEGTIFVAKFELNGSQFACSDSYIKHEWDFTPGVSIWVECNSDEEIENNFKQLSENGNVLLPLGSYGWSKKFAFVEDRFGVSWQLNLD